MSKDINWSIYHFKNYIQEQKLTCVLKIRFKNDEITPRDEEIKKVHTFKT